MGEWLRWVPVIAALVTAWMIIGASMALVTIGGGALRRRIGFWLYFGVGGLVGTWAVLSTVIEQVSRGLAPGDAPTLLGFFLLWAFLWPVALFWLPCLIPPSGC